MKTLRALAEFMKADIRERTRSYSFLVTVAATLYLGYLVMDGTIGVYMGNCQPVQNSAWTGMAMALCTVTFVALVGFYVVKNAIERDRQTGVGQVLAATPVSKTLYLLGKLLSNFTVLAIVTGILAVAAVLLQAFRGTDLDIPALVSPFLFLAIPAMFFIAGLAVFFESVKLLRGGFGNVLYFFTFTAIVVVPMETGMLSTDMFGLKIAMDGIQADVRHVMPDYDGNFSIGTGAKKPQNPVSMAWGGLPWTATTIGYRATPFAYGLVLSLIAAGFFDRFSSGGTARRTGRFRKFLQGVAGSPLQRIPEWVLLPVDALLQWFASGRIFVAELRLMLQGLPWWWYAAALGLWIASVAMDTAAARSDILPFLMIWPVLMWSGMGTREKRFRTGSILFSAPRPLARQVPATWGAGFAVALIFSSGILLKLAVNGEGTGVLALAAGAAFVSSLALALGVWSGTSKTFEACYVAFWYIGPAHHTASIDFLATTDAAVSAGSPIVFAAAAAVLFIATLGGRRRQIRSA
jgi:hypothetical protein